jgi:hypothetical protein
VAGEDSEAKFWLDPVRLESSQGFGRAEIVRIEALVIEHTKILLKEWYGYFGN